MINDDKLLDGRVVVVTGAGRGIGEVCARYAAACGATVVVNDVDGDAAEEVTTSIRGSGHVAIAHPADIASWVQAEGLVDDTVARCGRIDGLVNNAAAFQMAMMEDSEPGIWSRLLAVNVLGTAACGQAAARRMMSQGHGSIVNVTSGAQCGIEGMSVYGATKAAVASLTYTWALEMRSRGVRVNALAPQGATRMTDQLNAFRQQRGLVVDSGARPPVTVTGPVVSFLLSDLSTGVSGQVVRVSGDDVGLMTHPTVFAPSVMSPGWTARGLDMAFRSCPSLTAQPLGVVGVSAERQILRPGDPQWSVEHLPSEGLSDAIV